MKSLINTAISSSAKAYASRFWEWIACCKCGISRLVVVVSVAIVPGIWNHSRITSRHVWLHQELRTVWLFLFSSLTFAMFSLCFLVIGNASAFITNFSVSKGQPSIIFPIINATTTCSFEWEWSASNWAVKGHLQKVIAGFCIYHYLPPNKHNIKY